MGNVLPKPVLGAITPKVPYVLTEQTVGGKISGAAYAGNGTGLYKLVAIFSIAYFSSKFLFKN